MEQTITLDVKKRAGKFSKNVELDMLRNDEKGNTPLTVRITKNGAPYDLTGKVVTLKSKNNQGHVIFDDTKNGISIINKTGGIIAHTLPKNFASETGAISGYYAISQGDSFLDTTESFTTSVLPDIDLSAEHAGDYIPLFEQLAKESEEATASANAATANANAAADKADSAAEAANTAEESRSAAESARVDQEALRVSAEASRESGFAAKMAEWQADVDGLVDPASITADDIREMVYTNHGYPAGGSAITHDDILDMVIKNRS